MKKNSKPDFNQLAKAVAEKAEQEHARQKQPPTAQNTEDSELPLMAFMGTKFFSNNNKKK